MKKIKTSMNALPSEGRKKFGKSQTVPSQSIPLHVLVERHVKGLPTETSLRTPMYDEEEGKLGINPRTLDPADIEQLKLQNDAHIRELKTIAKAESLARFEAEKLKNTPPPTGDTTPKPDPKPEK